MSKEETPKEKTHVKIKGKVYEYVASRVQKFRTQEEFKGYGIETRLIENDRTNGFVVVQATIKTKEGQIIGQGLAEEDRSKGSINKTSALENCETSAIGRALASIGLAGSEYASANEVEQAIHQQENPVSDKLFDEFKKAYEKEDDDIKSQIHDFLKIKTFEEVKSCNVEDIKDIISKLNKRNEE